MSEDEELDLLIEHRQLTRAFLDAKAAAQADPGNEDLRIAKLTAGVALRAHRTYWRGIRDSLAATGEAPEGTAFPASVSMTTGVN